MGRKTDFTAPFFVAMRPRFDRGRHNSGLGWMKIDHSLHETARGSINRSVRGAVNTVFVWNEGPDLGQARGLSNSYRAIFGRCLSRHLVDHGAVDTRGNRQAHRTSERYGAMRLFL